MSIIEQTLKLNLIPGGVLPRINVSQYDADSRTINVTLYNGSTLFDIPTNAEIIVQGTKKDDKGFAYDCTYSGSVVTFVITQQMAAVVGDVKTELSIRLDDVVLGTANFIICVEEGALDENTDISETELPPIIALATEQEENAAASAAAALESATNAATSETNAAKSATNAATSATNAASSATSAASSATSAASSATSAASSKTSAATSATNADTSATNAANSATNAASSAASATTSKNNAAISAANASTSETNAATSAANAATSETNAENSALDSEAWAVGQRNGTDVGSTDETYQNNSKYYSNLAKNYKQDILVAYQEVKALKSVIELLLSSVYITTEDANNLVTENDDNLILEY